MAPLNILIVGCSVAGPTLASFLLMANFPATEQPNITLLERSSTLRDQGQNVDIRGAGLTVIRKLGLEKVIRANTVDERGVRIVDVDDQVWASIEADQTGELSTPTAEIEIMRGTLARILLQRSKQLSQQRETQGGKPIEYIFGDTLKQLNQDEKKVHVCLNKSGISRSFDIVVAADGLQSSTRTMVWGDAISQGMLKRYHMYGAFFSIPKADGDDEWRRWMHTDKRRGIMLRPSDKPDRTTIFMYVINDQDPRLPEAARKGRDGLEQQKSLMAEYFQDVGWECPRIIKGMQQTDNFYYDPVTQIHLDQWSKGRVVLLGDAGYCASPISGMGTTLAMTGAYNLAGSLLQQGVEPSKAFQQYEATMRPVVEVAQKLAPGMPYLVNPETAWGVMVLHVFCYCMALLAPVMKGVIKRYGPPASRVLVNDYGIKDQPDMSAEEFSRS